MSARRPPVPAPGLDFEPTRTRPTCLVSALVIDLHQRRLPVDNPPRLQLRAAHVHSAPEPALQPVASGKHQRRRLGHGDHQPANHPISNQTWDGIRTEFTLPALAQVRRRLAELMEDPEPVMRQLVRVFIDDGTLCPGFQFLPGGQLQPTVLILFQRALDLQILHNCFKAWMVTPVRTLRGLRPVDCLEPSGRLLGLLNDAAKQRRTAQRPGLLN
jgi:hypothetical protein